MKLVRRLLLVVTLLLVLVAAVGIVRWIRTGPGTLPPGSVSRARLEPGPHAVGRHDVRWVDPSRPTAANGELAGSLERSFEVTIWSPQSGAGVHPLLVFSHGFVSTRRGGSYLAEHLASHGYVVLAADYPLTHIGAPGGPNADDVVHQPADVSFLIDQALAPKNGERPFEGGIDPSRIGAFGISLGAATTTLVAFHPEWRDARIAAAISIAGPGDVFGPGFFVQAPIPFLMIAGTADAIVDYELNALPIPDRIHNGGLVTILGGTHIGFTHVAAGPMRLFGNPDMVGCRLGGADPEASLEHPFSGLFGSSEQGLLEVEEYPIPCVEKPESTITAARQQVLTTLAVRAFFDSHLALDPGVRSESYEFLTRGLSEEIDEVTYTPSRR